MKDFETLNSFFAKDYPEGGQGAEAKEPTDQKSAPDTKPNAPDTKPNAPDTKPNAPNTKPSESVPKAIPETLTQQQALEALIQGVVLGQKSGIYTLEDAELLSKAIRAFVKPGTQV
jgi:hypothetical protein